jgi:long-chain acyl-CoA synthetase
MKHYLKRLEESIKTNWNCPALGNYGGETFSFGQVATQIGKIHLFFEKLNIEKGEKVALCAKNTARWGMAFLAGNTYEAVMVPILADFHPDSVKSLVNHSESIILFTDNELWGKLSINDMPALKAVVSTTDFSLLYGASKEIEELYANLDTLFAQKYPAFL